MKRNNLTTALLAGLAGAAGLASTAQAVNLNPDGLGQVLIYPYYTVNKGAISTSQNQTLISVVNTTSNVKAVKVRFLEGRNSREVLDFNLYLSPFDVWTAAVFANGATGPATMITRDNSCTVPTIPTAGVPFRNFQYSGGNTDHPAATNAVLSALERTREGYVEMIEMGEVGGSQGAAATHDGSGVPDNCPGLVSNWAPGGIWTGNPAANVTIPRGGLYGAQTIVDVANGTMHTYASDAIEGFYNNTTTPAFLHQGPGSVFPNLGQADSGNGFASSFVFTSTGTLVQSNWVVGANADAVSAVYMHDAIYNEFNTESVLGGSSEWIITFPTKRFYVDGFIRRPFTTNFRTTGTACEPVLITYWDREENTPIGTVDFSPPPAQQGNALCFEAQDVAFNQSAEVTSGATKIFGSTYAANINTALNTGTAGNGWARITFETNPGSVAPPAFHILGPSVDGDSYFGLPVTGFWSASYVNSNAQPGRLSNYSGSYRHRASRIISGT